VSDAFVSVQGFVVWWWPLWRVMYQCYFSLYDIGVLLLLFFKKRVKSDCLTDFLFCDLFQKFFTNTHLTRADLPCIKII
jgi:hypothetical protein